MLLFLLLLFPLSLTAYCVYKKDPKQFIAVVTGLLVSAIVCACNFFFKFSHRVVPYSFGLNFVYYLEKLGLITVVVIYGLFFLVSKDTYEDRIDYFNSLMLSCYAVFVPFYVITGTESSVYPGFEIFVKPVIYLAMIFATGSILKVFYTSIADKKVGMAILNGAAGIVVMLIPSVIEAMYAINFSFGIILIVSLVYSLLPVGVLCLKLLKDNKAE